MKIITEHFCLEYNILVMKNDVRACDLVPNNSTVQFSLLFNHTSQARMEGLGKSIDELRGYTNIFTAWKLKSFKLKGPEGSSPGG